mgnify:CR=1 FL=1
MLSKEEKELLLKDLCARLPYGVICKEYYAKVEGKLVQIGIHYYMCLLSNDYGKNEFAYVPNCKPYLFPLSSMTEEQKKYIADRWGINENFEFEIDPNWGKYFVELGDAVGFINWCYENHLDINGLIPRNLAIDATDKNIY